jgi:alpha-L-rhamnosidase
MTPSGLRQILAVLLALAVLMSGTPAGAAEPPAAAPPVPAAAPSLRPMRLRCEYLVDPLAVDESNPRLSWELEPARPELRGLTQAAYQIRVSSASDPAGPGGEEFWDTGKVSSFETNQIVYAGKKIRARQRAYWRVRVWDDKGGVSDWSDAAMWDAGLTSPGDWGGAKWIGDPTPAPEKGFDQLPAPMLRREFACGGSGRRVERAVVHATALGLYELRLNGQRVGDRALAPEWTDYTKRIQYQGYDVTSLVHDGENCIGAVLGDGWYAGKIGLAWIVPKGPPRAIYGRRPRLLLRMDVRYSDGAEATIVSDESWRASNDGPIRADDILDGETYDARREMAGWDSPGFDVGAWKSAEVSDAPAGRVVAQPNEPIRVHREIKPVAVSEPKPGVYVLDMGQNMVGWCRTRVRGKLGETITFRHAEALNPDGTIYTANLRGAAQTDRYTPRSDGEETYEPRFTYHGFRYVEVTGLSAKPGLDAIVGRVANSSATEVGSFECSEPMLNRLWQNILWTQRGNLVGVPTDCPQRDERCGWMGDILAFAPTACFNMDMAAFFTKWVPDTRDAQATDGRFADFSPQPYDANVRFSGVPAWGDAGVVVPWVAYQTYGDKRILAEQFDACVRWIEYIKSKNPDLLWKNSRGNDYGDWLNADTLKLAGWPTKGAEVPKDVFATMFFFRSTQIVSEMGRALGMFNEQKKYHQLSEAIRDAFVRAYVSPDGRVEGDTQAGYALALHFGLIPEALRGSATERMVERFKPYDGQISTGFHSTLPLMAELSARGHNDDAYRLLLNRRMPSWGYEVDHGATTVWERWDGWVEGRGFQDPGMNSLAHYAIGAVGEWMYSTMLGIRAGSPGFASVVIEPHPGPGVSWAKGTYRSIRGPIECGWEQREGEFRLRFSIPPNVTARVVLPVDDAADAQVNGRPTGELMAPVTDGSEGRDGARHVWQCGSGLYEVVVRQQRP